MLCPYCGQMATWKSSSAHLYGEDYGPIWECECGARCGCHRNTRNPLGTLADARTRAARSYVHQLFDPLWKDYPAQAYAIGTRTDAYAWLAKNLDLTPTACHTALFDIAQCDRAAAFLIGYWLTWIPVEDIPVKSY